MLVKVTPKHKKSIIETSILDSGNTYDTVWRWGEITFDVDSLDQLELPQNDEDWIPPIDYWVDHIFSDGDVYGDPTEESEVEDAEFVIVGGVEVEIIEE